MVAQHEIEAGRCIADPKKTGYRGRIMSTANNAALQERLVQLEAELGACQARITRLEGELKAQEAINRVFVEALVATEAFEEQTVRDMLGYAAALLPEGARAGDEASRRAAAHAHVALGRLLEPLGAPSGQFDRGN